VSSSGSCSARQARLGEARRGRRGEARPGEAWQARRGEAGRGRAWRGKARQARHGEAFDHDEYDGRGAWQHSVPIGPDGAPMDKIQAQRAVFQLRRKVVNSAKPTAPVNKYGEPETEVTAPNWERLKIDVRERIDALAGTAKSQPRG